MNAQIMKKTSCTFIITRVILTLLLIFQKNFGSASFTQSTSIIKSGTATTRPAIQRQTLSNESTISRITATKVTSYPSSLWTLKDLNRKKTSALLSSAATADADASGADGTGKSTNYKKSNSKAPKQFFIEGPPLGTKPNYDEIHGPLGPFFDNIFLIVFRSKFAQNVGIDSKLPKNDYQGLMELTSALNARYADKEQVGNVARNVLRSLFPSWLPGAFGVMFAKPFPEFSSRMNAWATWVAGTWLMGECEINDCEVDGGRLDINRVY